MDDEIPNFEFDLGEIFALQTAENDNIAAEEAEAVDTRSDTKDGRFKLSNIEVNVMQDKAKNLNTSKATKTWYNAYKCWATERSERLDIENLSPSELNKVLGKFYAELCKKDGNDYEPESLGVMQASLDRYLKENGYTTSIVRGSEFFSSNEILKGKATLLRERGKGKRPNASKPLTATEEEELWRPAN